MSATERTKFDNAFVEWIDSRMPVFTMLWKEYGEYPAPKNFNYFWNFGALASFALMIMILSGVFLAMYYTPNSQMAFDSVERIMRDVNYGWLLRFIHMNGASMFFIAVYIHIFRGLYYGSYKQPRELLWMLGVVIFLLMMATAFMGYTLPWSQMSGWGATVITNLFSAIPVVGDGLVTWLWGGFSVDNPTLNRFFALHYLFPFLILGVVVLHVWALHVVGSNNPTGVDPKGPEDTLPFHPYYTVKDTFGLGVFMILFAYLVFWAPTLLTHSDHFVPFDPMVTPAHIVPEWYFLPFYAILRSFTMDIAIGEMVLTAKLQGVLAMFGSIFVLFVLPWLDRSEVRSCRYRPVYKWFLFLLVIMVVLLGMAGARPAEGAWLTIARIGTAYYFFHFLVLLPFILGKNEKTCPRPASISDAVLSGCCGGCKHVAGFLVIGLTALALSVSPAQASESVAPPKIAWPNDGFNSTWDRAALQRGYQVYKQVCSSCHSIKQLDFRHLEGIGFSKAEVKALASEYTIMDGPNDKGQMFERARKASDPLPMPFANEEEARYANGGALPPDFSLIVRARPHGQDYIYGLLTGYEEPPAGEVLRDGQNWNKYFPGHKLAMAAPLSDEMVSYDDGTPATLNQMAMDVSQFLGWVSDPHMEDRKRIGVKAMLYILIFTLLMYAAKRRLWAKAH